MKFFMSREILFYLFAVSTLAGCGQVSNPNGAAQGIEIYLQALVERDLNQMITASCSAWESQARLEFNSFTAVSLNLDNLDCSEIDQSDEFRLVTCSGSIIANYGAEKLEIDVADRTFKVIEEGGDWRMCGYAEP